MKSALFVIMACVAFPASPLASVDDPDLGWFMPTTRRCYELPLTAIPPGKPVIEPRWTIAVGMNPHVRAAWLTYQKRLLFPYSFCVAWVTPPTVEPIVECGAQGMAVEFTLGADPLTAVIATRHLRAERSLEFCVIAERAPAP